MGSDGRKRPKMSREERAKQFMPFSALKGYEEAIRKKRIVVPKVELSEDKKEDLDRVLQQIAPKDMVRVVYFEDGEYLDITGMVSRMDVNAGILTVVQTKIPFENLYELERV